MGDSSRSACEMGGCLPRVRVCERKGGREGEGERERARERERESARERERERHREGEKERARERRRASESERVSGCVCERERERKKERKREIESERERERKRESHSKKSNVPRRKVVRGAGEPWREGSNGFHLKWILGFGVWGFRFRGQRRRCGSATREAPRGRRGGRGFVGGGWIGGGGGSQMRGGIGDG